ncbi:HEAT repeat domain-containing protein [Adhaeribacter radiodurans]|uniref:HEAT repeat domain-containing protein n=1 Tax=Adhaeribacter radiodurans TaxID=2745197 RepID=A0A7L7LAZ1_9BACT|nr:HEAT repeat domain-containing protein [Adhaeribacter radiodurans]QMU30002.1 HEAT repeat domain-containing protein [Adhaeribacter radiodurans]
MKWDNIEVLLERYYDAETTLEEENYLRAYFNQTEVPANLKPAQEQFKFMETQRNVKLTGYSHDEWLFAKMEEPNGRQFFLGRDSIKFLMQIAASVLLVTLGFWFGTRNPFATATPNPEVAALRKDLQEFKKVLSPHALQSVTAAERIQVVKEGVKNTPADKEVAQVLINAMNFDPNVNVRLAACESLFQYRHLPMVREAYIQSLQIQTDPNVQAMLIDILVALKEKQAVDQVKKLSQRQNLQPTIKLKAQQAIGILI